MLLRIPRYFRDFKCVAGDCKDSCCVGWEIDIDEDTYDYYKSVEGAFGERLRAHMAKGEDNTFVLEPDRRCPFLNKKNLCEICIHLGEEALSEVCTEYPRFVTEYGNVCEKCLSMSCEVAGRLIFESRDAFTWVEHEVEGSLELEDEEISPELIRALEKARDQAIRIVQQREVDLKKRLCSLLDYAREIQEPLNESDATGILAVVKDWERLCSDWKEEDASEPGGTGTAPATAVTASAAHSLAAQDRAARLLLFREMEVLDEEWADARREVEACPDCEGARTDFLAFYEKADRSYEYEHLVVYFLFRYLMQSVYDFGFLRHASVAVISFLMIRDMDALRFAKNGGRFTLEDRIDVCRIYSKEVEHSEENLEYLADACSYEEIFSVESLKRQL